MKKIISVSLFILILIGCKPWDASKISVKKEPISPKILTLERRFEDISNATVIINEDRMKLFTKEVEDENFWKTLIKSSYNLTTLYTEDGKQLIGSIQLLMIEIYLFKTVCSIWKKLLIIER